jgi:hypothetical protein
MPNTGDDVITTKASPDRSQDDTEDRPQLGWVRATAFGFGIFAYFMILTVLVPSALLKLDGIVSADPIVQDLVVTSVWALALASLIVGLRKAQRRGLI